MLLQTPPFDPNFSAPDFALTDTLSGKEINLNQTDTSKGFVVAFISNHCPYVQEVIKEFVSVAKELQDQGIAVFAIMPNNYEFVKLDSPQNMTIFGNMHDFTFPYLIDETQEVARSYDAICTPDFFGFNSDGKMQFRGNISVLKEAMLDVASSGETDIEQGVSQGCSIKWK